MSSAKIYAQAALLPALLSASAFGLAQENGDDAALVLGRVEISAQRSGPMAARSVLSSVDILGAELIQDQQSQHTWELFSRAPGVMLTQFRQGNESGKLSFRGFNGEGEVNAVKLLIDGIPSNDNAGGMPFLDMLFPLEINSIEVVRGTNDPRYGLHNIAGNVNINTRLGGNDSDVRIGYGSFATRQLQFAQGIESGNWTQNYFAGYLQSNGYRANSGFDKLTVGGKWFYTSDDGRTRSGLILRHTESKGDEAGYLEAKDARSDPSTAYAYARATGGNRDMTQASLHLDHRLSERLSLAARLYRNSVQDQRWLRYSIITSQQERVIDETHEGLLASLTYRLPSVSMEAGVSAEHQHDASPRYNTSNQVRVSTTRDQHFRFDTYGGYVQAVLQPLPGVKLIPGYRVDKVAGDFTDRSRNVHYDIQDYGLIRQPKFSAVYAPNTTASIYANWGKTFQVGAGAAAYQSTDSALRPSINEGWEGGVKFTPVEWLNGRVALWRQDASDEVKRRLNDPAGGSENIGSTRREGADAQLNIRTSSGASAWVSYSWQRSRITRPDPAAPATLGKQIDHLPGRLYSAGYEMQLTPALKLSAWANGQGDYYLTTANTGSKYGAYTLLNASASYRVSRNLTLDVQLKNLANRYYEYVWLNDQTRHAPGDGRAVYVSANISL
ncbi:TonB-dependent receptor [Duganella sp. sic0402]|uniref:TonB-dependent receptor n=1 Tax=Duganella sp. sic0402 TaxID=2854786 RepID=UPI001C45F7C5|nr:TonB-dependent receptor [Duganella sp. sic0402]MBV7536842.1 TonB-dependent receptor [Duganella sp. sic0402]